MVMWMVIVDTTTVSTTPTVTWVSEWIEWESEVACDQAHSSTYMAQSQDWS